MSTTKNPLYNFCKIVLDLFVRYNRAPADNHELMRDIMFPVIKFINVSKRFNSKAILSKINLTIYRGEIVGITGPIGAGKTTLIQTALGLISPDNGSIMLLNLTLEENRRTLMQQINFASSSLRLNGYSSVMENLLTIARLYNVTHPKVKIYELAKQFHIQHLLKSKIKVYKLSAGENATVNLCKALLNNPEIIFFDEIAAHMDPLGVNRFKSLTKRRELEHKTTVLVSQNLPELISICDRIIFMANGKISQIFTRPQFKKLSRIYG